MKISIIGAGYVGLVTGACFAETGHHVTCVDRDLDRIDALKNGRVPIYEPGLESLIARNVEKGRIEFTSSMEAACREAEAVFLAVGTPPRPTDGHADLQFVYGAVREVVAYVPDGCVIITKSTVPVGTGDEIERIATEARPGTKVHVASNPEFLREGTAIKDFMSPDRIVVGTKDAAAKTVLESVYAPFIIQGVPFIATDRNSAELIKYAANAFLALKITYINEIALLCEALGSDIGTVAKGIGSDSRIGEKFLKAGPGYGGSCFPKDTLALVKTAQDARTPIRLIETATALNEQHKRSMAFKIVDACGGSVRGKKIAVLGLTFKANTDDMRESPSLSIIRTLQDFGAKVSAYDPEGMENARSLLDSVEFADNAYEAAKDAHATVVVTEWSEFADLDFGRMADAMAGNAFVDLRNVTTTKKVHGSGLVLTALGRSLDRYADTA